MYVYFFIVTTNEFLTFCLIPQLTLRYWLAQCTHSEKITERPQVIQNNWMPFQSVFYIYLSKVDFSSCFLCFELRLVCHWNYVFNTPGIYAIANTNSSLHYTKTETGSALLMMKYFLYYLFFLVETRE